MIPPRIPPAAAPMIAPFTLSRLVTAPTAAPPTAPITASRFVLRTGSRATVVPLDRLALDVEVRRTGAGAE
jgi:hypothetical protein